MSASRRCSQHRNAAGSGRCRSPVVSVVDRRRQPSVWHWRVAVGVLLRCAAEAMKRLIGQIAHGLVAGLMQHRKAVSSCSLRNDLVAPQAAVQEVGMHPFRIVRTFTELCELAFAAVEFDGVDMEPHRPHCTVQRVDQRVGIEQPPVHHDRSLLGDVTPDYPLKDWPHDILERDGIVDQAFRRALSEVLDGVDPTCSMQIWMRPGIGEQAGGGDQVVHRCRQEAEGCTDRSGERCLSRSRRSPDQ